MIASLDLKVCYIVVLRRCEHRWQVVTNSRTGEVLNEDAFIIVANKTEMINEAQGKRRKKSKYLKIKFLEYESSADFVPV